MWIANRDIDTYQYYHPQNVYPITKAEYNTATKSHVITDYLSAKKFVDKNVAKINDILTYSITITNHSNTTVPNIFFTDKMPVGTIFKRGSVKINKSYINHLIPNIGFYLDKLLPHCDLNVEFKVLITEQVKLTNCLVINTSTIRYPYIYNSNCLPIQRNVYTNSVETIVKGYKQI